MLGLVHGYAHGCVVVPVVLACRRRRLFELLGSERQMTFSRLTRALRANPGHLRVAMTLFESLGTVARRGDEYMLAGPTAAYARIPESAADLLSFPMTPYLHGEGPSLQPWMDVSRRGWDVSDEQMARMLDGLLVTPLMAALAPLGEWRDLATVADVWLTLEGGGLNVPDRVRGELAGFFHAQAWSADAAPDAPLTPRGTFLFSRPFLFGIVGSYAPMLARMDDLLFGDCAAVFARDELGHERHVDRTLNVHGSGRQHARYFGDLEQAIVEIFDTDAFDTQPAYIADVGCGDGTLLRHLHDVVANRTKRGRHLGRFPLTLVGIDYNEDALAASAATLHGLDHLLLRGDVGQPAEIVADLARHGIRDLDRVLHVRSFMDHDRPYVAPSDPAGAAATPGRRVFQPGFVAGDGGEIPPADAYRSLVEHLERWAAVLGTQPLVVLETHSLPPAVVRRHIDECENLHFDACQRFSHQLLVDANHFLLAAAEAGLFPRGDVRRYPRTLGFTRITLAAFERRAYRVRWAQPGDLAALERLEQECWAEGLQTASDVLRQRVERYPQGQFVAEMGRRVVGVLYTQRIADAKVLDGVTSDTVDAYHSPGGTVVQLIALNMSPDAQQYGLGDHLLELVLQYHEVSSDVTSIVGISRCKEYWRNQHLTHDEYIRLRDESGLLVDPVLRFHEIHGAEVQRALAGYRPHDEENQGFGVLIGYAMDARRRRIPDAGAAASSTERGVPRDGAAGVEAFLRRTTARVLDRDDAAVSLDTPLMELGLDSFALTELGVHVGSRFGLRLEPTFFFHHNTLSAIASFLRNRAAQRPVDVRPADARSADASATDARPLDAHPWRALASPPVREHAAAVAIVGIACRLPGGIGSPDQLWEALAAGRSLVGSLADIQWRWSGTSVPAAGDGAAAHVAYIDGIERFDAAFFSISPAEAALMDPQQRLLLELSWHCLEDAGYDPRSLAGTATGVFVGVSGSDYKTQHDRRGAEVEGHYGMATSTSMIPNRISYAFDFCGPSVQTDTACSSSLVAIHQAVRSLLDGECDAALAGGVSLICDPGNSVAYARAGMLAPDGRCKTFDAASNGYVRGEGAVLFLLKPLAKARADKDRIYATILGSATNHGGRAAGLTAPNPRQQAALLTKAWRAAGISPDRLGYIEAHGTGTALGDPIEIEGLHTAFAAAAASTRTGRCAVGSIKTNIGHLEAAAGAAGLLKAVLCLMRREIPATLNFQRLNPAISLAGSPLFVSADHHAWDRPAGGGPRVAGVSSFGSGGSNAHVVMAEYVDDRRVARAPDPERPHLIVLSARTERALCRREADLLAWLSADGGRHTLAEVSATLAVGRAHFEHRSAYVVSSFEELREKLSAAPRIGASRAERRAPLSGQLRDNSLIRRVTRLILDDLATNDVARGDAREDDLRALAELYVVGFDVEWERLLHDAVERRVALPTYPFEQESHWLHGTSAPRQEASTWCCLAEQWTPAPLPADLDWPQQVTALSGASVLVVYEAEDDRDALMSLLDAVLTSDAAGRRTASLRAVHAREVTGAAAAAFDPVPDVVFCLGPRAGEASGTTDPLATVFHVSRSLTQCGWEHAARLYYSFDEGSPHGVECEALAGFMRSAMLENPRHAWKLVAFRDGGGELTRPQALLQEWLADGPLDPAGGASLHAACAVRNEGSLRSVRTLVETDVSSQPGASGRALERAGFRAHATYIVTGAFGPIGERLCDELAARFRPTLVVLSRKPLDARRQQRIDRLHALGATVHYFAVDVADRDALTRTLDAVRIRAGEIHGVVHLARLVEDGLIASKSWASVERVLAAKVRGTRLLDELTAREPLELFLLFSSMAARGLRGSSDYAYAAAFQNAFARERRRLERAHERSGRTLALAWGPWTVDTYQPPGRTESYQSAGFDFIDITDACHAIDLAAAHDDPVLYLLKAADRTRVLRHMGIGVDRPVESAVPAPWNGIDEKLRALEGVRDAGGVVAQGDVVELLARCDVESMPQSLVDRADRLLFGGDGIASPYPPEGPIDVKGVLREYVGEVLKLKEGFDEERTLQSLGLDSVSAMQLATRVEARLRLPVQPRWFIEFSTIPALAEYLSAQMAHRAVLPLHG